MAVTLSQSCRKWKRYKYFVTNRKMGKTCSPLLVMFIDYVIDTVSILWTKREFSSFLTNTKNHFFFMVKGFMPFNTYFVPFLSSFLFKPCTISRRKSLENSSSSAATSSPWRTVPTNIGGLERSVLVVASSLPLMSLLITLNNNWWRRKTRTSWKKRIPYLLRRCVCLSVKKTGIEEENMFRDGRL